MPTTEDIHDFLKKHDKHGIFDDNNAEVVLYGDEYLSGYIPNLDQAEQIYAELQQALGDGVNVSITQDKPPRGPFQITVEAASIQKEMLARQQRVANTQNDILLKFL